MNKKINTAIDIDETITATPAMFSILSKGVRDNGGKVFIVTSRACTEDVRRQTEEELSSYGVEFDELFIIPDDKRFQIPCPHNELDFYQSYLWQKVAVCQDHNVDIIFEDDEKVIKLFETYAPEIQVCQVRKTRGD